MKSLLATSLASIFLISATSASAITIHYEGCRLPKSLGEETRPLAPIKVLNCEGKRIAKIKIDPTRYPQTINIAVPNDCDHYIVNFDMLTSGSLGTDCSFNVKADSVVRFKQTWRGCLCQFAGPR